MSLASENIGNKRKQYLTDGEPRQVIRQFRTKRPGQIPPQGRITSNRDNCDQYGSHVREETFNCPSRADRDYASRVARTAAEFDRRRVQNKSQFVKSFPDMHNFRKLRTASFVSEMQCAANEALEHAKDEHACASLSSDALALEKVRNVVCFGVGFRCVLTIENFRCKHCMQSVTVHPLEISCVPTSPTENCETFLTLELCLIFRDLHLQNGLSADGELYGN